MERYSFLCGSTRVAHSVFGWVEGRESCFSPFHVYVNNGFDTHTEVLRDGAGGPLPLRKEGMLGVSGALTVALEGEEGPASLPQPTRFLSVN